MSDPESTPIEPTPQEGDLDLQLEQHVGKEYKDVEVSSVRLLVPQELDLEAERQAWMAAAAIDPYPVPKDHPVYKLRFEDWLLERGCRRPEE
jgi:hypothetical protein